MSVRLYSDNSKVNFSVPINNATLEGTNTIKGTNTIEGTNMLKGTTTIEGLNMITGTTFVGEVVGITKSMIGLENVDNTSDVNKPISNATKTALDNKLPVNNPVFTGKFSGPDVDLKNINVQNTVYNFTQINDESNYSLENTNTNIIICGSNSDIVNLPSEPTIGMSINISNMSENDLIIRSNKNMYNLMLAVDGSTEIFLQKNFMYNFVYTENLTNIGQWYFRF
jgi:hypothetical protein